jgi:hypothetical protein
VLRGTAWYERNRPPEAVPTWPAVPGADGA